MQDFVSMFFDHRFDQLRLRPLKHGELSIELGDFSGGTRAFRSDAGDFTVERTARHETNVARRYSR